MGERERREIEIQRERKREREGGRVIQRQIESGGG